MYGTFQRSSPESVTTFSSRATRIGVRVRIASSRFGRLDGLAYQSLHHVASRHPAGQPFGGELGRLGTSVGWGRDLTGPLQHYGDLPARFPLGKIVRELGQRAGPEL